MFVLDTDHMSFLQYSQSDRAQQLAQRIRGAADEVCTSIITYEEQTRGWMAYMARTKSIAAQVEGYRQLQIHVQNYRRIRVLDFDDHAASVFERFRLAKLRIGTMDLKIAAICLANQAVLLTRNSGDFSRVAGLKFEDWAIA